MNKSGKRDGVSGIENVAKGTAGLHRLREMLHQCNRYTCRSTLQLSQHASLAMQFAELDSEVSAAGRVMLRRVMGKLAFITLRDGSGDVQLYLDRSIMNEEEAESFRRGCLPPSKFPYMYD